MPSFFGRSSKTISSLWVNPFAGPTFQLTPLIKTTKITFNRTLNNISLLKILMPEMHNSLLRIFTHRLFLLFYEDLAMMNRSTILIKLKSLLEINSLWRWWYWFPLSQHCSIVQSISFNFSFRFGEWKRLPNFGVTLVLKDWFPGWFSLAKAKYTLVVWCSSDLTLPDVFLCLLQVKNEVLNFRRIPLVLKIPLIRLSTHRWAFPALIVQIVPVLLHK